MLASEFHIKSNLIVKEALLEAILTAQSQQPATHCVMSTRTTMYPSTPAVSVHLIAEKSQAEKNMQEYIYRSV